MWSLGWVEKVSGGHLNWGSRQDIDHQWMCMYRKRRKQIGIETERRVSEFTLEMGRRRRGEGGGGGGEEVGEEEGGSDRIKG